MKLVNLTLSATFLLTACSFALAQKLPDSIRGYKVYKESVSIKQGQDKALPSAKQPLVTIGEPEATDVSLSGVELQCRQHIYAAKAQTDRNSPANVDIHIQLTAINRSQSTKFFL